MRHILATLLHYGLNTLQVLWALFVYLAVIELLRMILTGVA